MRMVWDDHKRAANILKHGMDFADAADRFEWESARVEVSTPSRTGGARYLAVGFLDGRLVALVFAALGMEAIAAISLRPASRVERRRFDDA